MSKLMKNDIFMKRKMIFFKVKRAIRKKIFRSGGKSSVL